MQPIDVLWFVEHLDREMDVACAVKLLAKKHHNIDIQIKHLYLHALESMQQYMPKIVVYPFFYFTEGALATEDYVKSWDHAVHFNLAWEELHYKAHRKIKAPADEFARTRVLHHAWGDFYQDYLLEYGVPKSHIFVNGQPSYQLYSEPYLQYYQSREQLAAHYSLDLSRRWIFIPENYRWAFVTDKRIEWLQGQGGNADDFRTMRDFSVRSLQLLLTWANTMSQTHPIEIIFRPRPATHTQVIQDFFTAHVGGSQAQHLHFIKGESVREWILASDTVISSYSTSLIEAAVAMKPVYMFEAVLIPEALHCDWYQYIPSIQDEQAFSAACQSAASNYQPLREWACLEMLANGDPIQRLVDFMAGQVKALPTPAITLPKRVRQRWRSFRWRKKAYFNPHTHEKDRFDEAEVQQRVARWHSILN